MHTCYSQPFLQNFNIVLLDYFTHRATFSLNDTHCYDVAKNTAMAAIGFSIRTVRAYISRI